MNKVTRMLAIAGMALAAGATIGATPAMAASSATGSGTTVAVQATPGDRVVGYYRSYRQCDRAGDIGEWSNRWDEHDCYRVRYGFHRGWFALSVDWNWHDNNNHHHGGGDNGNNNHHHGGDNGNNNDGDHNHHHGDNNNNNDGDHNHHGGHHHHELRAGHTYAGVWPAFAWRGDVRPGSGGFDNGR
jgi:hypothetical protein